LVKKAVSSKDLGASFNIADVGVSGAKKYQSNPEQKGGKDNSLYPSRFFLDLPRKITLRAEMPGSEWQRG